MKFQIIKDYDSSRTEVLFYLWEVGNKGQKIYCIDCDKVLVDLEKRQDDKIIKYAEKKYFKPEIIKEIEI